MNFLINYITNLLRVRYKKENVSKSGKNSHKKNAFPEKFPERQMMKIIKITSNHGVTEDTKLAAYGKTILKEVIACL